MDVFKISVDTQQVHKITQENFDQVTKKQAPWYQPINGQRHDVYLSFVSKRAEGRALSETEWLPGTCQ